MRRSSLEGAAEDELNAPALYERAAGRAALWLGDARRLSEIAALFRAIGRSAPYPAAHVAAEAALLGRCDEAADKYRVVLRR